MLQQLLYYLGRYIIKAYTTVMLKMTIKGQTKLPCGPKIFVANHPTTSDPFVLLAVIREKTNILIKHSIFKVPAFGKYLTLAGYIPVVKDHGYLAFEKAKEFLKHGSSVIIFIEGGLSPSKGFLKPRTGAVRLAISTRTPIFPIGIGVHRPNITEIISKIKDDNETGQWYFRGPYALTFGKCLTFAGDVNNRARVRLLSNRLMYHISLLASQSSSRIS